MTSKNPMPVSVTLPRNVTTFWLLRLVLVPSGVFGDALGAGPKSRSLQLGMGRIANAALAAVGMAPAIGLTLLLVMSSVVDSAQADGTIDRSEREKIAFIRAGGGNADYCSVQVMNRDGSGRQRLTGWRTSCSSPATWSPDGRRLAFYARGALWVMNSDGSNRRRLSSATWADAEAFPGPSFSPDGESIVYPRNPSPTINASAVYIVRAGAAPRRLTKERFAYDPLWSPRGDLIAFRSDRDDDEGDIYVMRSDGSRQRRLTRNRDDVESFAWSPDGRFLAYAFYNGPIYRVPATGGARRLLARFSAADPDVAWSPDGRHIAYVSEARGDSDVSVMTSRGLEERRLTTRFFNYNPSWSPDSKQLAFAFFTRLNGPSRGGIAVMDAHGRKRRELSNGGDAYPAWQPTE